MCCDLGQYAACDISQRGPSLRMCDRSVVRMCHYDVVFYALVGEAVLVLGPWSLSVFVLCFSAILLPQHWHVHTVRHQPKQHLHLALHSCLTGVSHLRFAPYFEEHAGPRTRPGHPQYLVCSHPGGPPSCSLCCRYRACRRAQLCS